MKSRLSDCAESCLSCFAICTEVFAQHCLSHGGSHVQIDHAKLMLDCADICKTSGAFLLRESKHHRSTCEACVDICSACAASCRTLNDPEMTRCADACSQ